MKTLSNNTHNNNDYDDRAEVIMIVAFVAKDRLIYEKES